MCVCVFPMLLNFSALYLSPANVASEEAPDELDDENEEEDEDFALTGGGEGEEEEGEEEEDEDYEPEEEEEEELPVDDDEEEDEDEEEEEKEGPAMARRGRHRGRCLFASVLAFSLCVTDRVSHGEICRCPRVCTRSFLSVFIFLWEKN